MARAFPVSPPTEYGAQSQPGDWQALRGELVALLDQVEGQYAEAGSTDPAFAGFAQRMRDLRYQVGGPNPDDRRREALRSVKRQIDRFNDRSEAEAIPHGDNVLQSAIQEIRARTAADAANMRPAPPVAEPQLAPRFDELASAVTGLTGRLGQLEAELGAQRGTGTQVAEIADQVGQLSHVVELLAGAVGETGQVKRLEAQIAGLADLIGTGPKVDLTQLTDRLDQVSATVDRLADLQVQQIQHVVREAESAPHKDAESNKSLVAIEASVRNIYDRIDTLESSVALPSAELERISDILGQIGSRLGSDNGRPDRLLGLVDALNGRINEIEDRGEALAGLRGDIGSLRDAVVRAIEPRFAAIETQLGAIGERLNERPSDGPGIAQLEAQIRLLVARMDQTGEQLSGLAELYGAAEARAAAAPAPDFEALAGLAAFRTAEAMTRREAAPVLPDLNALADLVAARTADAMAHKPPMPADQLEAIADIVASKTSAAVARQEPQAIEPAATPTLSEANLNEIEMRISRLVDGFIRARAPEGVNGMREGIGRVEERLALLEASLTRDAADRHAANTAPGNPSPAQATTVPVIDAEPVPQDRAAEASAPAAASTPATPVDDAMPRNPSADAPLKEFGFPDLGPVRAALEAKNGPRRPIASVVLTDDDDALHFTTEPLTPQMAAGSALHRSMGDDAATVPPSFDPANVARPPRPESSLELQTDTPFASAPAPVAMPAEPVPASSRNTFIEAARRAAQRQDGRPQGNADSPMGRALSRFQPGPAAGKPTRSAANRPAPEPVPPPPTPKPGKAKADKPTGGGLFSRGSKAAQAPIAQVSEAMPSESGLPDMAAEKRSVEGESFLVRHRKPILVAASLVAVSFMTLNLVMQRLSMGEGQHVANASPASTPKPAAAAPVVTVPDAKPAAPARPAPKPASVIAPPAVPAPASTAAVAASPLPPTASDPVATGSIKPDAAMNYASGAAAPMPPALAAANSAAANSAAAGSAAPTTAPTDMVSLADSTTDTASTSPTTPAALDSPVKVELPPDTLGPLDLRQSAADGDARSQFEIAAIYSEGRAIPQDYKEAAIWYERAAAQGFAPAQYRLGNLYETGKGVDKDYEQARLWYQRAAEAGNRMAMHNLAALYAGGQFGKQDFASAVNWFQQAADRGMKDSQFNLGMLYARGLGVPQSLETSYKWFALAALTGDADAAKARDNVARSLDAEAIKKASAEVAAWKPAQIDLAANFAPIGTWQKDFNPGPAITAKEVVMKVQSALARLGYDVGTPDGHAGPKTAVAIKAFEQGTGMTEVGAINPRLLAVLGSQPV